MFFQVQALTGVTWWEWWEWNAGMRMLKRGRYVHTDVCIICTGWYRIPKWQASSNIVRQVIMWHRSAPFTITYLPWESRTLDWLLGVSACGTFGWAKIVSFWWWLWCGWLAASVEFDFLPTRYRWYDAPPSAVARSCEDGWWRHYQIEIIITTTNACTPQCVAQRSMTKKDTNYIISLSRSSTPYANIILNAKGSKK